MRTFLTTLALAVLGIATVFSQGSAFTYQGRLNDGSTPANGGYDLRFDLFTNAIGGNPVASPATNSLAITNGLFTVRLDFGSGIFNGNSYWLEIGVRTNGGETFTLLNSRQELTPIPYAMFASFASAADASTTLNGNAASFYASTNPASGDANGLLTANQFLLITNIMTPQMFGVVGDGVTDDTAKFQTLLNHGGEIFVPPGNYLVSNLFVTNNTHIRGSLNARLLFSGSATNWMMDTWHMTNIQIEGLMLDGGGRSVPNGLGTRNGVRMDLGTNGDSWIKDCKIIGFDGIGLQGTEPGGVLSGQLYDVGYVAHVGAKFCGIGFYQPEIGSDSAEYSQWTDCEAVSCWEGFQKTAGNVLNLGHRISLCTTGIRLIGPGSNGNHGNWSSCTVNHNTTFIYASDVLTGDNFVGCIIIAGGAIIFKDCNGMSVNGCQLSGPAYITVTNSPHGAQNGFIGNKLQGDWPLNKSVQINDGGAFFFGNWCWNNVGSGGVTNASDGSFGNPPFIIRPTTYTLSEAFPEGASVYDGASEQAPSPYLDRDTLSNLGSHPAGGGAIVRGVITSPSIVSVMTATLLSTNQAAIVISNWSGVIEYGGQNSGRIDLNNPLYPAVTLNQGYNTVTWTNSYTNSSPVRFVGFEYGKANSDSTIWITSFNEQPLQ